MRITVAPIELGTIRLPAFHPRAAEGTCPIRVFAIDHPDGVILVDTGPGDDDEMIDELYAPDVTPIVSALNTAGYDERDVAGIVNTHLHFDHCGQNRALPHAPVWVQRDEVTASEAPLYTVPEWAAIEPERARIIDGDVTADNLHDESWAATGRSSIERLVSMGAHEAHFSHDPRVYRRDAQGV